MEAISDPFPSLGSVYRVKGSKVSQLKQKVENIKLNPEQTGDSKVNSRQGQNMPEGSAPRLPQDSISSAGGQPKKGSKVGNINLSPQPVIHTTPKNRSSYSVRIDKESSKVFKDEKTPETSDDDMIDSEPDFIFDSDDDISLDDSDLVDIKKSHESCKKIKWFRAFFKDLDKLSNEEISTCKWHCPACQGGAGAIYWYKGKQPLLNHAKTTNSRRPRLHRLFAELLEEEFRRRTSITVSGETYGKWKGLHKQLDDFDIVWPPMVLIINTRYEQDDKNQWIGIGNQELLDCFSSYSALKAQQSYGAEGHQGMSVLIFESSPFGYFKAVRLHDHFILHKRDREAWNHRRTPVVEDGKHVLFGFLASEKDIDFFNRHSTGNSTLKFEMRSYKETVYNKMKHNNNSKAELDYLRNQIALERMKSQVLKECLLKVTGTLRCTIEESDVVQLNKGQSSGDSSNKQEVKHRLQENQTRQLEGDREKIVQIGEDEKSSHKKHQQEEVETEKLTGENFKLMNECLPGQSSEESDQK